MAKMSKRQRLEVYGKEAREYIDEMADGYEQPIVVMDGFDSAIIGIIEVRHRPVVIYSYDLMIDTLVVRDKMSADDASEYIDFNCDVSGEGYPVILHRGCLPISIRIDSRLFVDGELAQQDDRDERQLALPL